MMYDSGSANSLSSTPCGSASNLIENKTDSKCTLPNMEFVIPKQSFFEKKYDALFKKATNLFLFFNHFILVMIVFGQFFYMITKPTENIDSKYENAEVLIRLDRMQHEIEVLSKSLRKMENWRTLENNNKYCHKIEYTSRSKEIESKIEQTLQLYTADKVGMVDYALESSGGVVISTPNTISYKTPAHFKIFGLELPFYTSSNPNLLLRPETFPGQCYAFYGNQGHIQIKLSNSIQITAVTLEHTHFDIVDDTSSAPNNFTIYGLDGYEKKNILGIFYYDITKKPLQTFWIKNGCNRSYEMIEMHITSNYGHPVYTCVYRLRVHGIKN